MLIHAARTSGSESRDVCVCLAAVVSAICLCVLEAPNTVVYALTVVSHESGVAVTSIAGKARNCE